MMPLKKKESDSHSRLASNGKQGKKKKPREVYSGDPIEEVERVNPLFIVRCERSEEG